MIEETKRPNCILPKSDLASGGKILFPGLMFLENTTFTPSRIADRPNMTLMLNMLEPNTFPTESAAPPEKAAIIATVNSGKVVDIEINVNPTEVLPSREIAETLKAYVITVLLA